MRFAYTPEQDAFRAEARRLLQGDDPSTALARAGWLGAGVADARGGQGLGMVDLTILAEAAGNALLPGALPFHQLAAIALDRCDETALLPDLCTGARAATFTLAYGCAIEDGRITGDAPLVPGGGDADVLVVGLKDRSLAVVERDAITVSPVEALDLTRPVADLRLDGPATPLARAEVAGMSVRAAVLLGAESVGVGTAALDMAVEYARARIQFGAPIGSFQAIKHKAADVWRDLEAARLAVAYAAWALDAGEPDHAVAVAHAKVRANEASIRATEENIQIHGGIGVTWDHRAHLLYRRARANATMFGTTTVNTDRLALATLTNAGDA